LPVQLTSFVGREREITEVKRLLTTTRLLTFTGAGGCGKTRLALQVAVDVLEDYTNGVWLVELAPLSDPSLIPQVVAGALRVREQPGQPILSTLSDYLRSKQMILVLDNCEHLIAECAKLTDAFLHASPSLKILATSREGLGIGGELTYRVPSLSIPDLKNLPPVENLSQYEAVRLFIERAIFSQPTFAVTNQNAPAVAQICHKLDGIPLAIELAAARVKVLPVEQIAKRLDDSFRLLTGGSRTALPRQQTLRAAIDWSYNLLSEAERALLRRLSVFAGGWILEAAEAICADLPLPPARGGRERAGVRVSGIHPDETLDLLTHLVDKSLVVMECEGGEGRYRLLETVRQYARDKLLESGEAADLRGRHRDWYLSLAEQSEPELRRRDQVAWLERLEAEHDNIRAALEWSLGGGEVEAGLRIAGAIQWFWFLRAHRIEGHEWLTRLMTKNADVSASVRAKALIGAGNIATGYGDHNRAMTLCEEGLALYRELGDREGIAKSLSILGVVEYSRSNYGQAAILCEENLALYRELGNKEGIALTLNLLGDSARLQGQYERATTLFEENLALSRELGDTLGIALSARGLGMVKLHQGDYKRATELFKEDLMRCREMKDEVGVVISLINLGDAARCQDDYDRAAALYEESLALCRETGYTVLWWGPEVILRRVGRVALHRGHYDRATEIFKEGLSLFRKRGDKRSIVECLEGLAAVAGAEGQPERAARLYGVAEALRKAIDVSLTPSFFPPLPPDRADHDRSVAAARAGLGEEAFKAAWEEGRRMKIEEAVQLAVGGGQ
jgi:non-specific serine/threonine protein kinase